MWLPICRAQVVYPDAPDRPEIADEGEIYDVGPVTLQTYFWIFLMAFYILATGIGLGFITYALAKLFAGRFQEAKLAVLVLAAVFAVKFALSG